MIFIEENFDFFVTNEFRFKPTFIPTIINIYIIDIINPYLITISLRDS